MYPLVSIIIPIYKVEQYIERCVESVIRQTYRHLEIILVDDSSPDKSMELAELIIQKSEYSRDLTFKFLKHEYNRGISVTRNTGINAATGDYLFFIDSDDEITENCIDLLVEPLNKYSYDIVMGYYQTVGEHKLPNQTVQGELLGVNNIAKEYQCNHWHNMVWNKLISRSLVINNKLYFQEKLLHEDELWSALLACSAESMYAVPVQTYIYYFKDSSITISEDVETKLYNYKRVLKGFYSYYNTADNIHLEAMEIVELRLKNMVLSLMSLLNFPSYKCYLEVRQCDVRSVRIKNKIYKSHKARLISLDQYLPPVIGYLYKVVVDILLSYK